MAKMKSPKEKLALYALREAAQDEDNDSMDMDTDVGPEMLSCPKCGYHGPETKFKPKPKLKPEMPEMPEEE